MKNLIILVRTKEAQITLLSFLVIFTWWLLLNPFNPSSTSQQRQLWAAIYQIIAVYGFILGIIISRLWGGLKSTLGRAILAFSLGLFFQSFGQTSYSYYIFYKHIDIPFPSIGDIGFFGSIPFYLYGILHIAKASGVKVSLRSFSNKTLAVLIPLMMLIFSYYIFLTDYMFDWSDPIKIFLDFGYPLGQAIYVSVAILTFILSRKILGGIMRGPILFLTSALIFQYISDYTFLYQASHNLWEVGRINDLMYSISYLLMTLGLIYIGNVFRKVKEG